MSALSQKPFNQGQMLLSILIAIAIFSILAHALFTLVATSYDLISFNKSRITARHLAQEKIETIRNLPYDEVATIGGIPSGTIIPQSETVNRNGLNYTIKTDIVYIDDPYDGVAPEDLSAEDYKRIRVEVSWEGLATSRKNPIVLISDVSALATDAFSGGTLLIQIFDSNGNAVPQAQVSIVANSITPAVNLTLSSDNEGRVTLPGATECIECYEISVTKSGMSTDKTYSAGEVANPSKPHASVIGDQVTQLSFAIDQLGSVSIHSLDSRENDFTPLGNVSFRLHGSKIIGTDTFAKPVYKYDKILTTNSSGNVDLTNFEWDVYHVTVPDITSYNLSGTTPLLPLNLSPSGNLDFSFAVTPYSEHSFFITVKDNSQNLIASASARLYDDAGFETTETTGVSNDPDEGQALISNLTQQIYHFEATASGYLKYTNDFSISGSSKADIILIPE